MPSMYTQNGQQVAVKLPKSKEIRTVVVIRGFLLSMKDTETGVTGFGYNDRQCLESLEDLLHRQG